MVRLGNPETDEFNGEGNWIGIIDAATRDLTMFSNTGANG